MDTSDITLETTQTLDTMLHQVLNQALVAIGAEAGSLMLVANKQGILQIKARLGKPRPARKAEPVYKIDPSSIAGWVVTNKQSYLCADVESDAFFTPSRSGRNFLSLLSMPIIYDDKVLAVINADAETKNYFTDSHMYKLQQVAELVAPRIAARISISDAMAEVGVELTRLPREGGVDLVLRKICEAAIRSLGADVVTLYQYLQKDDVFPVEGTGPTIAGEIYEPSPMRRKVYPRDVPWVVVKERRSGFYSNVREHDFLVRDVSRPNDTPRQRFIEREGIQSMAALLLPFRAGEINDEEVVGVMFANYRTRHDFNIDERSALATFADYAAVAILNARHEEKRRIETMRMAESFSANFAHRMSNLAGTSRVATQFIREKIAPSDELIHRQLNRIEREANVLFELAETLVRRSRTPVGVLEFAEINISNMIDQELNRLAQERDLKTLDVYRDIPDDLPPVSSIEVQMQQVIHDIITNAVESTEDQEHRKLTVRARHNKTDNRIEVAVIDNGPGISTELQAKLFSFGVTNKKGKLGIGLWWCKTFMQAAGGDLTLEKTIEGQETTFLLSIPAVSDAEPVVIERHNHKVLVVDDQEYWLEQLEDILISDGFAVQTANSFNKALQAIKGNEFDLAIIDVRLTDSDPLNQDGLKLLSEIGKSGLRTLAILMTGYDHEVSEDKARKNPHFAGFFRKDKLDLEDFRITINNALSKIRPLRG